MGVKISKIIPKREIELIELSGKRIAIDTFNVLFQFLASIRQRDTGEPLKDSRGRVTSHLSGLFYRTLKMMDTGIRLIYVFDGKPPEFKKAIIQEREAKRDEAREKWKEAVREGRTEEVILYAQRASRLTDEMIDESKKILDIMGVPWVQAPSEGEAQACQLVAKGNAYAVGSQDIDSLLFGCSKLVRNLSITGRRKLSGQEAWITISPEMIELSKVLSELGITREQLIIMGMLIGTDYNPKGIRGIGPKTALEMVKKHKTLDNVLSQVEWNFKQDPHKIYDFFLNPPVSDDYKLEWKDIDEEKIIELMVEEHDFSRERVENAVKKLEEAKREGAQSRLEDWLKK